jgi:hypothetical protein
VAVFHERHFTAWSFNTDRSCFFLMRPILHKGGEKI